MNLHNELLRRIDLLDATGIDYALCGGIAVALHGYPRFTKDIDLLVKGDDIERITELVKALEFDLPTGPIPFAVGTRRERVEYRISKVHGTDLLSLALLPVTPILQFVWDNRELFAWRGRQVKVVSAEGLAWMKRLAGREQDRLDLKMLGFEIDGGLDDA